MSDPKEIKNSLTFIRDWAQSKIDEGNEPPWAWFQYMKLIETIQEILTSQTAVTTVNLQQPAVRSGSVLRLVGSTSQQENAQLHPGISNPQMPM